MKVSGSDFLTNQKEYLRQLIAALSAEFGYASVLGADSRGKQYSVQKSGATIGDSRWTERGFVVRVHNGRNYSEYSFNQLPELSELLAAIRANLQLKRRETVAGIPRAAYPVIAEEPLQGSFYGEVAILPETLSVAAKIAKLTAIKDQGLRGSEWLIDYKARYEEVYVHKLFLSPAKDLEQSYVWSQGYLVAIARRDQKTQFAYRTFSGLQGPELLEQMAAAVSRPVELVVRLLDAEPVKPGEYDVICSPEISGLIAHEAFGHGVEMDMFVKNRAKAVEYLGRPVASELVTMHDGAAAARHVSSYWFDDEGTPATDTIVIDRGVLKTGISDLLSSLRLGAQPTGNGKRESFERKAYARMTNTFFAAGSDRLDAMIGSIRHGYLLDGTLSGMEDPKDWGIQCVILYGAEIRDGKLTGKLVTPVIMTGFVPDLLQNITMVSADVGLSGAGACGKGHKELVKVSDGGPYIKTRARLG